MQPNRSGDKPAHFFITISPSELEFTVKLLSGWDITGVRELANANRREARDRFYVFTWGFVAGLAAMGALFVLMLALAALAQ